MMESPGALPSEGAWFSSWYVVSIGTGHIAQSPQSGPRRSPAFKMEPVLSVSSFSVTSLSILWLRLQAPNAGALGSSPDQGTRSHMLQRRVHMLQLKISHAETEIKAPVCQHNQINK